MNNRRWFFAVALIVAGSACFVWPNQSLAQSQPEDRAIIRFSPEAISRGYTMQAPSGNAVLGVFPGVFARPATAILQKARPGNFPSPDGFKLVSPIYEYDIRSTPIMFFNNRLVLALRYDSSSNARRQIRFWNSIARTWNLLPSSDVADQHIARALLHLPYSKVAVFEENTTFEGRASWYNARPMTAASNDYPVGSSVRVTNLANGSSVVVTITERWAGVAGRIIDLSKDAFAKLENPSAGTIVVRTEPNKNPESVVPEASTPSVTAASAIVVDSTNGSVLFEKTAGPRPIASITKLMTVMVFLEWEAKNGTHQFEQQSVTYQPEDAVDSSVESSIRLYPGDTLAYDECLKAVLISSANNAAKTLARSTGLSHNAFVGWMNDAARRLGMDHTHFVEPTGIDPSNVSTPADIAKLVNYLMNRNSIHVWTTRGFDQISANTGNPGGRTERIISLYNTNHILNQGLPIYGGKTGYLGIGQASFALKFVDGNGRQRTIVILGSTDGSTRNSDMVRLARWALS